MYNFTKVKQSELIKSLNLFLIIYTFLAITIGSGSALALTFNGNPPIANNDSVSVYADNPILFNPLTNDTDPDNDLDINSLAIVKMPVNGQAAIYFGQIGYLPNTGFTGTDTVWYEVSDATLLKDTAYAVIHVLVNTCTLTADYNFTTDNAGLFTGQAIPSGPEYDYVWDMGDGSSFADSIVNYTYSSSNTYTVCLIVIDSTTSCMDSICKSVTINITPPCNINTSFTSSSDSTGLASFTVDNIDNNFTYQWFIESDTITATSTTHQYGASGNYNVTLVAFNNDSTCTDTTTQNITINIDTIATCSASIDVQVDPSNNGAITVSALPANGVNYEWNYGDSTIVSGPNYFNAYNYSNSGSYNVCVTITDANACVAQACTTVNVTILNFNSCGLAAGITPVVSANGTVNFTAEPQNLFNGISYIWEYGDGTPNDTTGGGFFGGETSSHTYLPGTYQACVYVTNDMGNCADYACTTIVVDSIDPNACSYVASFTYTADSTGTVDFTASPGGFFNTDYTYDWSFGDGNIFTGSGFSPNAATNIYATGGTYNVCLYMTEVASGCADTICQNIVVYKDTTCNLTADFTFTQDSSGTVNYTASPGGILNNDYTYDWSFGDGNTSTGDGGFTPNTASNLFAAAGQYNTCLVVTQVATGCKDTVCYMVDVIIDTTCNLTASYTFTQDSTGNVTLTGEPSNILGGFTYIWNYDDGSPADTTSGFFGNQSTHTYSNAGSYNICVTVIEDASGCSNTYCDLVNVIIDTTCTLASSYTYTQDSLGTVNFTATPSSFLGGYTYIWTYDDGSAPDTTSGLLGNQTTHTYPANGQFNTCVTITEDATGCTNTYCELINVVIDTTCDVTASFTFTQDSLGTVNFTANPSNLLGGYTYLWNYGDGSAIDTTSGLLVANINSHNYVNAGNYNACVTVIDDANGCSDTYCQSISVIINGSVPCSAVANFSVVANDLTVSITDLSSSNNDPINSYSWTFGDGNQSNTNGNQTHTYLSSGTYNICLSITTQNNCNADTCLSITVNNPAPVCNADFSFTTGTPSVSNMNVDFNATVTDTVNYNYNWNFGDGSTISNAINPSHIYTANGNYNVCLVVTHSLSTCIDTVCKNVNITGIGFNELAVKKVNFNLYPNPVKNSLTISINSNLLNNISIEIYNINGALVYTENVNSKNVINNQFNVNTDKLVSGTYMVKVYNNELTGNAVLIKE